MKDKLIWPVFWALVVLFIAIFIPRVPLSPELNWLSLILPTPELKLYKILTVIWFLLIASLSVVLLVITVKSKITGSLRKFLLLTGASAIGFVVLDCFVNILRLIILFSGLILSKSAYIFIGGLYTSFKYLCLISFLVAAFGTVIANHQR